MSRFVIVMLLSGLFVMPFFGVVPVEPQETPPKKVREGFASDRVPGKAAAPAPEAQGFAGDRVPAANGAKPVAIDQKRVMKYLQDICAIGPRISGSTGMQKQQELIKAHFEGLGAQVKMQRFTARQVSRPAPVDMANLIVSWQPDKKRRVILCSHYDTRPIADQEPDERKWREPFVSANDGGSGVALLMELGHHMKDMKTECGVDFVFFDGEEFIWNRDRDKYFFGSEHFAADWRKTKGGPSYAAAVLLDMVGGKFLRLPVELNSWRRAEKLCREIWDTAAELKCRSFMPELGHEVLDDHIALQKAGIPAIDIIDFDYRHWHKLSDVPENCSAESLDQVARVLSLWLQRVR
jgi:glutaminyl-peptide cyclotransferase